MSDKIKILMDKGVVIRKPDSVFISDEVSVENIEEGVEIKPFCRVEGEKTYLSKGTVVGMEGPAVVENCVTGKDVVIGSGYFSGSVFLDGSKAGSNNHFREGCILEEKASTAHCVGLKQTIIFPYATLGSLINFCDCMLTGGTSQSNHSEVGSSFIHFNFTPDQDKATPSLMGNVHEGVFLRKDPIFLGGQGGIAGPVQINFGNTTAAGTIVRRDEKREGRLIFENIGKNINMKRKKGSYFNLDLILKKNLFYTANLIALKNWYFHVRKSFYSEDMISFMLLTIDKGIKERTKRIFQLAEKAYENLGGDNESPLAVKKINLYKNRNNIKTVLEEISLDLSLFSENGSIFLEQFEKEKKNGYLETVSSLSDHAAAEGSSWLFSIITSVMERTLSLLTEFESGDFY